MTLEVRAFAKRLLFGETLDDKLRRPGPLTDRAPGAPIGTVMHPGRPANLPVRSAQRAPFPKPSELGDDEGRARALHAFANHELLAIELMALALLRFPDAPGAFRRDLVRTITEEQRHLRRYRARMNQLGLDVGDLPVNGWFWSRAHDMASPRDYVVRMSLLFEQANLDFAGWYRDRFSELGDTETAALLHSVYEDEIRHVAVGVEWFDTWRVPSSSRYEAWRALLPHPLTPARARGIQFDRAARERAGMTTAWIDAVERCTETKGRAAVCWFPELDAEVAVHGRTASRAAREVVADLENAVSWLARPNDVVLVSREPSKAWRDHLDGHGFERPHFATREHLAAYEPIDAVEGWARSSRAASLATTLGGPGRPPRVADPLGPTRLGKQATAELLAVLRPEGRVALPARWCESEADLVAALEAWESAGVPHLVAKSPWGSSGMGQRRCKLQDAASLRRTLPALVGPLWDIEIELSALLDTRRRRGVVGIRVPRVDPRGRYSGHWLGGRLPGLTDVQRRRLYGGGGPPPPTRRSDASPTVPQHGFVTRATADLRPSTSV